MTFYTPAQAAYKKEADKNSTAANELNSWFQNQTILEKDSDIGLQNQTVLLVELRGKPVTAETIHLAIQRIQGAGQTRFSKGKGTLHFVPEKPRQNPLQHADDDPTRKTGQFIDPRNNMVRTADGGWRSKNAAEYAAERRAADRTGRQ